MPVAAALRVRVVEVMPLMIAPAGRLVPVRFIPTTKPAVPPAFRVRPVAVAVAGTVSVKLTPGVMLAMLAPAGMPAPLTPMPTARLLVLAVVTTAEAAVVAELATATGAVKVTVALPLATEPTTEMGAKETRPVSALLASPLGETVLNQS